MIQPANITTSEIWSFLQEVLDPEVPVLSVVELGIVREVKLEGNSVEVKITPTYTGCPAMKTIEDDISSKLKEKGIEKFSIKTILVPTWTTDWIKEEAREKLRVYGIAPPQGSADKNLLTFTPKVIQCPHCGSSNTFLQSQFGSTACKALYVCHDCKEPFDYFKCI
jgi:ring-1,2-phenylacetyl-CoA epoxidase subunit PaaD